MIVWRRLTVITFHSVASSASTANSTSSEPLINSRW
jgi:hypothetical protein